MSREQRLETYRACTELLALQRAALMLMNENRWLYNRDAHRQVSELVQELSDTQQRLEIKL